MDPASVAMYWMGMYALLERLLPLPLRQWVDEKLKSFWQWLLTDQNAGVVRLKIPQRSEGCINHLFRHALVYIASLDASLRAHNSLDVVRIEDEGSLSFHLPLGEPLQDTFRGVAVKWQRQKEKRSNSRADSVYFSDRGGGGGESHSLSSSGNQYFILEFPVAGRSAIVSDYLKQVTRTAIEIQHHNTQLKLYTNATSFRGSSWKSSPFTHPSTFDSLALDTHLHRQLLDDLDGFRNDQELYHRLGRAWKRGYLLYGPPGTGKTSLIAAIANRLHYDIYELELTSVYDNAELKSLLMNTTRKSIIVIEDIDCSFRFEERGEGEAADNTGGESGERSTLGGDEAVEAEQGATVAEKGNAEAAESSKLTLSGLLNFTDGLWSGCTEERIFVFTTNFKERLDAALLRPGRMDMHIHLSYCTLSVVEKLVEKHLSGVSSGTHPELFGELGEAVCAKHTVTPAAVAETLISHQVGPPEAALRATIRAFRRSADALRTGHPDEGSEWANRRNKEKSVATTRRRGGRRSMKRW